MRIGRPLSVPALILCGVAALGLAGCSGAAGDHSHASRADRRTFAGDYPIEVLCTTGQVADLVRHLGSGHVRIEALMGPGIDPHSYKALPSDMDKLSRADIVFYNGLHLEGRLGDTLERIARQKPTLAVTEGLVEAKDPRLRMAPEFQGNYDPHVWHDPSLWADCAEYMVERLATFDPTHADEYRQNLAGLRQRFEKLGAFCRQELATIPAEQRVLVTSHDAFWYLGSAYDMEVHGLQGISTADEIDLGKMAEVVNLLVERKIKAAFIESAVAHRTIESLIELCRERGHEVANGGELYADALGPPGSSAETYEGMMRANVSTIVQALR
jgi:manganese/zinc/iron transport system substrate-binding protein